jgi:hypothetical protein
MSINQCVAAGKPAVMSEWLELGVVRLAASSLVAPDLVSTAWHRLPLPGAVFWYIHAGMTPLPASGPNLTYGSDVLKLTQSRPRKPSVVCFGHSVKEHVFPSEEAAKQSFKQFYITGQAGKKRQAEIGTKT